MKVLRYTKDGKLSLCSSPYNLVGKGRCNHILGSPAHMHNINEDDSPIQDSSTSTNDSIQHPPIYTSIKNNIYVVEINSNEATKKQHISQLESMNLKTYFSLSEDKKEKIIDKIHRLNLA